MNPTLIVTLARKRVSSIARLVALALPVLFLIPMAIGTHSLGPIASLAGYFAIVCAAGAIGQDVSAGTLQLLLARPVTRPQYVVSRWVGAGLLATAWNTVVLLLAVAGMMRPGVSPNGGDLLQAGLEGAGTAFAMSAVMIMFSSLVGGLGDLGILAGVFATGNLFQALAAHQGWDAFATVIGAATKSLTQPELSLDGLFGHGALSWSALVTWASTITLALFIALVRTNRRELSYAGTA